MGSDTAHVDQAGAGQVGVTTLFTSVTVTNTPFFGLSLSLVTLSSCHHPLVTGQERLYLFDRSPVLVAKDHLRYL